MEETYTSVAICGNGEADPRATSALLEDFLPKRLGSVLRPESIGRGSLRAVINWIEGDDQLGENGTIGSTDLVRDLLALRDSEGDDIIIIILWPASPTQEDIAFAESAMAAGIPVLDLCAALDTLVITDEMREIANPAPEKPKRLTKAQKEEIEKTQRKLAEVIAKEALELEIAKAAEIAQAMATRGQEMVVQTEALDPDGPIQLDPWAEVGVPLDAIRKIVREELQRIFSDYGFEKPRVHVGQEPWIEAPEVSELFEASAEKKEAAKAKSRKMSLSAMADEAPVTKADGSLPEDDGTPPFDGPYTDGKLEYYMNEDGQYRRSNGKPRRGETKVMLTPQEVAGLAEEGWVK